MFVSKTSTIVAKNISFSKVWLFIEFNFAISDLPDCDRLLRHLYCVTILPFRPSIDVLTGYKTTGERKKERVEIPGNDRRDAIQSLIRPHCKERA